MLDNAEETFYSFLKVALIILQTVKISLQYTGTAMLTNL